MNSFTKFFLVLLRLAIGWHLLFAGIAKFQDDYKGSEGYLQNSAGPLAPYFHTMIGDNLADNLAVRPAPAGAETAKPHERFPYALGVTWNDYFEAFATHYDLTAEQQQTARKKMEDVEDKAVNWMANESLTIKKTSPYGEPAEITKTVPEWVKVYQATRQKQRDEAASAFKFPFATAALTDNTRDAAASRAEVTKIRGDLSKELDKYKQEMKDSLRGVLTEEQKARGALSEPIRPAWRNMTRMDWIDFQVRWGLVISGACLLLGFFTRLNCFAGAVFLLMFYLAVPPWPGLPEAFRAEGYPYVNKNIVEMLALLTLMTTRSGRWAGLDGLLYYLNPFRRKTPEPRQVVPGRLETFTPYQVTPTDAARVPAANHPYKRT